MNAAATDRRPWTGRAVVRIGAGIVTAAAAGIVAALILYQTSVEPGAAIVRSLFQANQLVTPPAGFAAVARTVSEQHATVRPDGAPAASLDIYRPAGAAGTPRPVVLWVHGGGFISTSPESVADYAVMLAHAGYVVASLGYSLAPGTEYPAPVRQGSAAP